MNLKNLSLKPLLLIPALGAVLLLSACAGPIPKADPSEAWIGLKEEAPNDLMAERVDGKRVDDGRFFEVPPGDHRLDVTLYEEEPGDDNQQDRHAEPRHTVFVGFACVTDVGVGRGKGRKKRNAYHDAAHLAVANVVTAHTSAGLTAKVGIVKEHRCVTGQESECEPVLCHPVHVF